MNTQKKSVPNSIESQIEKLEYIRSEIKGLKDEEEALKEFILEYYKTEMDKKYKEKTEPFGAVNFIGENFKITLTTPKKVKWDQEGLKKLYADGAPVDVEFSVSETEFKQQDDTGKAVFLKHRTVTPGKITIEVKFDDA